MTGALAGAILAMAALPEIELDVVAKSGRDVTITEALVGGELERTIAGASTLTLEVHDPHRKLLRSPDLNRAIDLKYAGVWFRLVRISKSEDTMTLTFEDRDVAYLRQHKRPRAISRAKMTRAQFVRSLVREVKANRIKFYCPEVNERQPIGKAREDQKPGKRKAKDRDDKRQKGLERDAALTIKGARITPEQRRNVERAMDVADTLNAGPKATKALLVAGIGESNFRSSARNGKYQGIWQTSEIPGSDVEGQARYFLRGGKGFQGGGAMALAKNQPSLSAGGIATKVEASGQPASFYDAHGKEADRIMDAYGGASGTDSGGAARTVTTRKKYEFTRGKPGENEDSWTAIQRLAGEVKWRAFMDKGTLYFISDDELIASKARYTWTEDTEGVHWIDFDIDQGQVSSEIRVSCRTDLFDIRIGTVVAIREMGVANGRWLVSTVRQSLFEADTEVTLTAATPKLPEPDAEKITKTVGGDDADASMSSADAPGNLASDTAVMKCWRKADAIDKLNTRYSWGGGHNASFSRSGPNNGWDCSGFVSAVLHAGGLLSTPMATGGLINWGQLGEGKYMTVWVKENGNPHQSHTFMTFTPEGPNKGTQKFAEAGGADSSHTGWHAPRNKAGFVPRHWPNT